MDKSKKYICIHGHYYQPPRENAWLEMVEVQDSAAPFHNWNARITDECYGSNAAARIQDKDGYIIDIVNNYAKISFNFGPTLLSWMEVAEPDTYRSILEADRLSIQHFNGHGSALAQVYNHIIMPLANDRDKHTQVIWGIRDFEHRFGRKPKGMWLAETAVDLDTLEVLLDHGIEFTILAPRQAKAIRPSDHSNWEQLDHAAVDPRRPYFCTLKSGRKITLFFYDGHVSQGVAFSGLLNDGKAFAQNIIHTLDDNQTLQLAHIATDGESYGHHHAKGEMALADCLDFISKKDDVTLCNYASFMAEHTATWEAEIYDNSSWSCVHGVERWRSNCGCHTGGRNDWTQTWRQPLRETLDWLRDQLIPVFEEQASLYLKDPWSARNDYITIVLNRSNTNWQTFLDQHALINLEQKDTIKLRQLLEMQRQSMLMFTSCGWFFDEVSGLETNQILQYAQRAIAYAQPYVEQNLHDEFIRRLEQTPSNIYGHAANSYNKYVEPARVDTPKIAMHFVAANLYEPSIDKLRLFNFKAKSKYYEKLSRGGQNLILGRMRIHSSITLERTIFCYAIWQGSDNFTGQLSLEMSKLDFTCMCKETRAAFKSNTNHSIEVMQKYFGSKTFTLDDLRKDAKHKLLTHLTKPHLAAIKQSFRAVYEREYDLMTRIWDSSMPLPKLFQDTIQTVLNEDLNNVFQDKNIDLNQLQAITKEFVKWERKATTNADFQKLLQKRLLKLQKSIEPTPADLPKLRKLLHILKALKDLKINIVLLKNQNSFFARYEHITKNSSIINHTEWQTTITQLAEMLKLRKLGEK